MIWAACCISSMCYVLRLHCSLLPVVWCRTAQCHFCANMLTFCHRRALPSSRMLPQVRLVLEYCDGGSLRDALDSRAFGSGSGEYNLPHLCGSYSAKTLLFLRLC